MDCDHADQVAAAAARCERVLTFSQKDPRADVYGTNVRKEGNRIAFHVRTPRYEGELAISTPGLFNVENALAAVAVAEAYHIPYETVEEGLLKALCPRPHGALHQRRQPDFRHCGLLPQRHEPAQRPAVRADGVPRPPADGALRLHRRQGIDPGRAWATPPGEFAHRIILTEDDPGPEEVEDICADIGVFLKRWNKDYAVIPNRERAVETAILEAQRPAVVLLAGKGCEIFQKRKNGRSPASPTAPWPSTPWRNTTVNGLDKAFAAAGAAAWGGLPFQNWRRT